MFRKKKKNEKLRKYINSLQFRMCLIFIIVGIVPIMLIKHGILTNYQDQAVKLLIISISSSFVYVKHSKKAAFSLTVKFENVIVICISLSVFS